MTSFTPGSEFVADTMALVLRIEKRKHGPGARAAFDMAEAGQAQIFVPAMVFAEILRHVEKKRIGITLADVFKYLAQFPQIKEFPMSLAAVNAAGQINDIAELHDRLIAGTALLLKLPLLTNDPKIQASSWVKTIWK